MAYIYVLIAYVLGSIPFGLLLTNAAGLGDIRSIGSGNIGTTNVLRTGNKALAAFTLFLDMFKGVVAVGLAAIFSGSNMIVMAAALAVVLGHMYPVWLKFKGGKGVATTFGVMLALWPPLGGSMLLIWAVMALVFKISSLAALTSFGLAPVIALAVFGQQKLAGLSAVIAAIVFWKHRENIQRLLKGEESKISFKKSGHS